MRSPQSVMTAPEMPEWIEKQADSAEFYADCICLKCRNVEALQIALETLRTLSLSKSKWVRFLGSNTIRRIAKLGRDGR